MPRNKNAHGQYFTPRGVADLMVDMIHSAKNAAVLEPSAGEGVFLDALASAGFSNISAVEIDPALVAQSAHPLINASFVSWASPVLSDVVIGNPPYIRWRDLSPSSRAEVESHPLYKTLFNSLSDYLTVFIALGIEALAPGGELIFITPSFWMHTTHSAALREWMLQRGFISEIVDFGEARVFSKVASSIIVFRFVKAIAPPKTRTTYFKYCGPRSVPTKLSLSDSAMFTPTSIPLFSPTSHWTLAHESELSGVEALEKRCSRSGQVARLGEFVDIANGMVSGLDKAFRLDDATLATLSARERAATLRVLKALSIEEYYSDATTTYIHLPSGLDEKTARVRYPRLMAQLASRRSDLEKRYAYGPELAYWDWSFKRSFDFFMNGQAKGFVPSKERLTNRDTARFSLAPLGVVATQDVTAFSPKDEVRESLEYIVAYLNQACVSEWIRRRGLIKGGVAEFSERPLAAIPFLSIDWQNPDEVQRHETITALMQSLGKAHSVRFAVTSAIEAEFAALMQ